MNTSNPKLNTMSNINQTPPTKFTQEIKDAWLTALKSGEYKQGFYALEGTYQSDSCQTVVCHCCIGVLGVITPGLDNNTNNEANPYSFLDRTLSEKKRVNIYTNNDTNNPPIERDYSNVIPLIESLPVQD